MRNFNTNMPTLDRSWRQPMDYALMSASRCGSLRDLEREIKRRKVMAETQDLFQRDRPFSEEYMQCNRKVTHSESSFGSEEDDIAGALATDKRRQQPRVWLN
ncbi:hypothetical protein RB195_011263 [Necator americanus]|uniref:Uncharacterized protein n=1 Tax=Necator americanus TaxID=51031 RepID=A0ABR1D4V9_NECAM